MKQICFVCQNTDCKSRGSEQLMNELARNVAARSLDAEVRSYVCFGACTQGPNIVLYPQKSWYTGVKLEDVPEIVDCLAGGPPVARLDSVDACLKEMVYGVLDADTI